MRRRSAFGHLPEGEWLAGVAPAEEWLRLRRRTGRQAIVLQNLRVQRLNLAFFHFVNEY